MDVFGTGSHGMEFVRSGRSLKQVFHPMLEQVFANCCAWVALFGFDEVTSSGWSFPRYVRLKLLEKVPKFIKT